MNLRISIGSQLIDEITVLGEKLARILTINAAAKRQGRAAMGDNVKSRQAVKLQ